MKGKKLFHYSIPHLIHIEMTYSCNSKCFFCYNPYRNSPIDYKKIDDIVNSVAKSKIPHVYLIGGEPSLLKISKINQYIDLLSEDSSVTIVTNGLKYMDGLSRKLACFGVAIHGDSDTQEWLSGIKGGYTKTIENIRKYVADGFDVRCIPVLTSKNYDQIYNIIKLAKELGMESVFVDKFEIGGMGLDMANQLKPSLEQFRVSLGQMIQARDDFNIPVGFGTAIPYCLDERLIKEDMFANCGVGVTFGAINPNGDFRICNQSEIVYGNVLEESVEKIWNKKEMQNFRDLSWVKSPCKKCFLVNECTGGCKVDLSCSSSYCIDYHIRENKKDLISQEKLSKLWKDRDKQIKGKRFTYSRKLDREIILDKFTRLNSSHKEKYVITRYQTVEIDNNVLRIVEKIRDGILKESQLVKYFTKEIEEKEMIRLLNGLELIGAIHFKKFTSIDWEITKDCNLRCKHCITGSPQKTDYPSYGLTIRALTNLCESGLKEIAITGGEPFVYPHIWEMLKFLKAKNVSTRLITNGTLLTSEETGELVGLVDEIAVSLDGIDERSSDFIRGKGSFKKTKRFLKDLRKEGIPFSLYFTIHKRNQNIEKMIKFSQDIGAEYCRINEISYRARAEENCKDISADTEIICNEGSLFSKCNIGERNLFVNSLGDVFPCVELSQTEVSPIGNIYKGELEEIYKDLLLFIKRNKGRDCPYSLIIKDYETLCKNNNIPCQAR